MTEPAPTTTPAPSNDPPAPPASTPDPAKPADETATKLAEAETARKVAEEKLAQYEAEKTKAEEAERQKKLTLEQKLAEAEAAREKLEHKTLVQETREKLKLTDPIFKYANPQGKDATSIEGELTAFKTDLDAYVAAVQAAAAPVATPGGDTPPAKGQASTTPAKPIANRFGWVDTPVKS